MDTKAQKRFSKDDVLVFFLKNRSLLLVLVFSTLLTIFTNTFLTQCHHRRRLHPASGVGQCGFVGRVYDVYDWHYFRTSVPSGTAVSGDFDSLYSGGSGLWGLERDD